MSGFYKDYRGTEVLGVSMYIPSMKWVLLAEIDKDEVLAPVKHLLINTFITAVVVIAIIILLYIAFVKIILKPLHIISNATKDIARTISRLSFRFKQAMSLARSASRLIACLMILRPERLRCRRATRVLPKPNKSPMSGIGSGDLVKNEAYWSDELYRIVGFAPQEFVVTYGAFLNCVHPDDREFVRKSVDDALHGKNLTILNFAYFKDGSVRIVNEKDIVTFDPTGSGDSNGRNDSGYYRTQAGK